MIKVSILVALLCTFALANLQEDLQKIEASEFGKGILDTLQMHMETGDPVQRFSEIMQGVETMFEQDQKESDQKNRVSMDLCDRDIADYNTDNNALLRRLSEIQTVLDRLNPFLARTTEHFNQKTTFRDEVQAQLDELAKVRRVEAAEYQQRNEENDYARFVISTVQHMFTDNNSGSFLQTKDIPIETVEKVTAHLTESSQKAATFTIKKSYKNIFNLLAQITTKMQTAGNSHLVQRILDLCQTMLNTIEDNRLVDAKNEASRIENFNIQKNLYEKDIGNLNTQIGRLNADIVQTQDKITTTLRDQSDTRERQGQKAQQITDREQECQEIAFAYKQTRDSREENRQLVSQIISSFAVNQRDFRDYINLRKAAGDFEGQNFQVLNPNE